MTETQGALLQQGHRATYHCALTHTWLYEPKSRVRATYASCPAFPPPTVAALPVQMNRFISAGHSWAETWASENSTFLVRPQDGVLSRCLRYLCDHCRVPEPLPLDHEAADTTHPTFGEFVACHAPTSLHISRIKVEPRRFICIGQPLSQAGLQCLMSALMGRTPAESCLRSLNGDCLMRINEVWHYVVGGLAERQRAPTLATAA